MTGVRATAEARVISSIGLATSTDRCRWFAEILLQSVAADLSALRWVSLSLKSSVHFLSTFLGYLLRLVPCVLAYKAKLV